MELIIKINNMGNANLSDIKRQFDYWDIDYSIFDKTIFGSN